MGKKSQPNPLKLLRKIKEFQISKLMQFKVPEVFYWFSVIKMKIMLVITVIKKRNGKKDMKIPE